MDPDLYRQKLERLFTQDSNNFYQVQITRFRVSAMCVQGRSAASASPNQSRSEPFRRFDTNPLPFFFSGKHIPGASERVNIVYTWVQQLLQDRLKEGGLTRAAPIGSRIWQVLSDGYLQFEHCRCAHSISSWSSRNM